MKIYIAVLTAIFICFTSVQSEAITMSKENDIKILMELMGNSTMVEDMANLMVTFSITEEKKRHPDLPKKVEYALSQAINDVIKQYAPELKNLFLPIYDKYYTHQEIKDLIVFFKTPTGRKYSSILSPMTQDLAPIVQNWAQKIGPIAAKQAEKELLKFGYK